jgi:hypothetical protein
MRRNLSLCIISANARFEENLIWKRALGCAPSEHNGSREANLPKQVCAG